MTALPHDLEPNPTTLTVTAYGTPVGQGSKKHVGNGRMVEVAKGHRRWRGVVEAATRQAMTNNPAWDTTHTALWLTADFYMPRPKSHYRTGRFAHELRPNAPGWLCATGTDLDKLVRAVGDALTCAGAIVDDRRIVAIHAVKRYPDMSRDFSLDAPGCRLILSAVAG